MPGVDGLTPRPRHGDQYLPLIEAADVALYEAKRSGKNRAVSRAFIAPENRER